MKLNSKIKNREKIAIDKSFGDLTDNGPWFFQGETYRYIDEIVDFGDGEEHWVIVQRESDRKFFTFCWIYSHRSGDYFFEYDLPLTEVFQKPTVTYE